VHLRSRNDNDFSGRYPGVLKGLAKMRDDTVIDGEDRTGQRGHRIR
jgi:ATP-dependent DNA ligase